MSEEVTINRPEYWSKSFEMLQHHWALIEISKNQECEVYFINMPPTNQAIEAIKIRIPNWRAEYPLERGIIDQMHFSNIEAARVVLKREGFIINEDSATVGEHGQSPIPPFNRISYYYRGFYSSGTYTTSAGSGTGGGCLVILTAIISTLCLVGVGALVVCKFI